MLSLASCGKTSDKTEQEQTTEAAATAAEKTQSPADDSGSFGFETRSEEETSPAEDTSDEFGFDFDAAFDSLYLCGEKIEFPLFQDTIPDSFEFIEEPSSQADSDSIPGVNGSLQKDGQLVAELELISIPSEKTDSPRCTQFSFNLETDYSFYGLTGDMTEDEIIEVWGEPSSPPSDIDGGRHLSYVEDDTWRAIFIYLSAEGKGESCISIWDL